MELWVDFIGQKGQDKWVVEDALPGLRNGFFLDLAATDGISINNTFFLEVQLGWTGIAIEPNQAYFSELKKNRKCICQDVCIDEVAGNVSFLANGELGGIIDNDTDNRPTIRSALIDEWKSLGRLETLEAKPLHEILEKFDAPKVIDYFSFDVEGAETRILRRFPFDKYTFLSLTIERPTPELNDILFRNGYIFVRNVSFDTYYVHQTAPTAATILREPFEQVPEKNW